MCMNKIIQLMCITIKLKINKWIKITNVFKKCRICKGAFTLKLMGAKNKLILWSQIWYWSFKRQWEAELTIERGGAQLFMLMQGGGASSHSVRGQSGRLNCISAPSHTEQSVREDAVVRIPRSVSYLTRFFYYL